MEGIKFSSFGVVVRVKYIQKQELEWEVGSRNPISEKLESVVEGISGWKSELELLVQHNI